MADTPGRPGPVRLGDGARAACRPLSHDAVRLEPEGWLGAWQAGRERRNHLLGHELTKGWRPVAPA